MAKEKAAAIPKKGVVATIKRGSQVRQKIGAVRTDKKRARQVSPAGSLK